MTISVLTNPIDYIAINGNFDSLETDAQSADHRRTSLMEHMFRWLSKNSLSSATASDERCIEFTPQQDEYIRQMALEVWSPDATSRVVTATIESMSVDGTGQYAVDNRYMFSGTALSVSLSVSSSGVHRSRPAADTRHVFFKNVRYRLSLSSNNASAVDRASIVLATRMYRQKS